MKFQEMSLKSWQKNTCRLLNIAKIVHDILADDIPHDLELRWKILFFENMSFSESKIKNMFVLQNWFERENRNTKSFKY